MIQFDTSEASGKLPVYKKEKWISLFNGENLDGWQVKIKGHELGENWNNTFRVVNGAIRVDYSNYEEFNYSYGHLFYRTPYSSYRLKLKYRFIGEQVTGGEGWAMKNSGVMLHCQSPDSMGLDQDFPVSIEVQLLGGLKENEKRSTANLCTPGTHVYIDNEFVTAHCTDSSSETFYGDEWISLDVEVRSDSIIRHFINGEKVMEYTHPVYGDEKKGEQDSNGKPVKMGYISLQSESHPIEFKDIYIQLFN